MSFFYFIADENGWGNSKLSNWWNIDFVQKLRQLQAFSNNRNGIETNPSNSGSRWVTSVGIWINIVIFGQNYYNFEEIGINSSFWWDLFLIYWTRVAKNTDFVSITSIKSLGSLNDWFLDRLIKIFRVSSNFANFQFWRPNNSFLTDIYFLFNISQTM